MAASPYMMQAVRAYANERYPADLIARLACGLGKRRCARARGDSYDYLVAERVPRTPAGWRALLDSSSTSLHLSMINTTSLQGPSLTFIQTERELVLDLDLRDAPLRRLLCACGEKSACSQCWLLAELAAAVGRTWLTGLLDLGPMMVVFSGGKGVHLWWGAPQARRLTVTQRHHLFTAMEHARLHGHAEPHMASVRAHVMEVWVERGIGARALLANGQSPLARYLHALIPPHLAATMVWPEPVEQEQDTPEQRSRARWAALATVVSAPVLEQVVWTIAWPVVDAKVLQESHLLKAPFSLHATTGCVALPLDQVGLETCDPPRMPRATITADHPLWGRALDAFRAWLDACAYPIV